MGVDVTLFFKLKKPIKKTELYITSPFDYVSIHYLKSEDKKVEGFFAEFCSGRIKDSDNWDKFIDWTVETFKKTKSSEAKLETEHDDAEKLAYGIPPMLEIFPDILSAEEHEENYEKAARNYDQKREIVERSGLTLLIDEESINQYFR